MTEERETRVETLKPGDQLRWLGDWYDIVKVGQGISQLGPLVTFKLQGDDLQTRDVVYMRGVFVAAEVAA